MLPIIKIQRYTGRRGEELPIQPGALLLSMMALMLLWIGYLLLDSLAPYLPALLLAICLATALRLLRRHTLYGWSPLVWFLATCAMYCGMGPLLYVFGSQASIDYVNSYYPVDAANLQRTNLLNTAGIFLVCLGFELGMQIRPIAGALRSGDFDPRPWRQMLLISGIGGGAGLLLGALGPLGAMSSLMGFMADLLYVSLFILVYLVARGQRQWIIPLLVLGLLQLLVAISNFSKQDMLTYFLTLFLGCYLANPNWKLAVIGFSAGLIVYAALTPFVSYGREKAGLAWGETSRPGSLEIVTEYVGERQPAHFLGRQEESYNWWIRLNYSNAQAFCMDQYDKGFAGDSFLLGWYSFVPRFIWPEKPLMTPGREFNRLVTGSSTSQSSPGFLGEAYWNGGWFAVIVIGLVLGLEMAFFTVLNLRAVIGKDPRWIPVVLASIKMGYRQDDWFIASKIASIPWLALILVVCYLLVSPSRRGAFTNARKRLPSIARSV